MNKKAQDIINKQATQLDHAISALHMLLDNPDDADLNDDDISELRNSIGMLYTTRDELNKITE